MRQVDRSDLIIATGVVLTVAGLALYEPLLLLVVAGFALIKSGMMLGRTGRGD